MKKLIIILVIMSGSFANAQEGVFQYRVGRYPVDTASCPSAAEALGQRFETITGRTVVRAACESTIPRTLDVVITYAGDEALRLVSTVEEYRSEQGFYATRQECIGRLSAEIQEFEQNTGLKVVVAYCYRETELQEAPHPYRLRIDGFGVPRLKPITMISHIYSTPTVLLQDIMANVQAAARAQGLVAPQALVDFNDGLHRLVLKYYATRELPISLENYTSYESAAACRARLREARDLLTTVSAEPMAMFCAQRSFSEVNDLYELVYVKGSYSVEKIEGSYPTMSDCDSDRTRMVQVFHDTMDLDAAGALCSYQKGSIMEPNGVSMRVFVRR